MTSAAVSAEALSLDKTDPFCYDACRRTYKRGRRMAETDCWKDVEKNEMKAGVDESGERPPFSSGSVLCSAQTYSTVQGWSSIKCIRQMGPSRETCRCPNQKWPYIKGSLCHPLSSHHPLSLFHFLTNSHFLNTHTHIHTHTVAAASKTFASSVNS